jgi:hypothetical protein
MTMDILRIAYTVDVVDDKVLIANSEGDRIHSSDCQTILDFLARTYGTGINNKWVWNIDRFFAVIFHQLGIEICQELTKEPDKEAYFTFENGKPILHPLTEKPKLENGYTGFLPDGYYSLFYLKETNVGLRIGNQGSYFYNLSGWYEDKISEIDDLNIIKEKVIDLFKTLDSMGITKTLSMSSPATVFEKNMITHMDIPTVANIDHTHNLTEDETAELIKWAEICQDGKAWTTNFAVGKWDKEETYDYDLQSAYGYAISKFYDFRYAEFFKLDEPMKDATNGILKGTITIYPNVKISPIPHKCEDGHIDYPVGLSWNDVFPLEYIRWIYRRKIGEFKLDYGYYWIQKAPVQPFEQIINRIFAMRKISPLAKKIAKRFSASLWSKFIQRNFSNGKESLLYNPLIAMHVITTTNMRLADFIYDNNLQDNVLYVATDGCRTTKKVEIKLQVKMGEWKETEPEECLVLSPSRIHTPSHHPQSMYYQDMVDLIKKHPDDSYYSTILTRRITLKEAVNMEDITKVGTLYDFQTSIDLISARMEQDMVFDKFPISGKELLENKYYGKNITEIK